MRVISLPFVLKSTGAITGIFCAAFLTAAMSDAAAGNIADAATIRKWISGGALIVDVRTTQEFSSGNYKGSINIPLADVEKELARFGSKDRHIVVYCRTGNRSGKAKELLEKHGFKYVLNGGGLSTMP